jgi:solute carrier family 25 folate transporter 32
VVRTRLQTQVLHGERQSSMAAVFRAILRQEGSAALYRGLGASTLGLSHIAIQFPVYEWVKRTLAEHVRARQSAAADGSSGRRHGQPDGQPGGRLRQGGAQARAGESDDRRDGGRAAAADAQQYPVWVVLCASFISKVLASSATYPHELIRARLQDQRLTAGRQGAHYRGIVDVVMQTVRREGVSALWHGFSVNLVRAVPQSMITFGMYEWLIWTL